MPTSNILRFLEKPEGRRDHLQHDQCRHLRARAGDLRSHSGRRRLVDRAQLLSVVHRTRAKRSSRRSTATTGSTSGRRRNTCRCTATSWTAATRCRRSMDGPAWRGSRQRARVADGAQLEGPLFVDRGCVVEAGAAIGPYTVLGQHCQVDEGASFRAPSCGPARNRPRGPSHGRHSRSIGSTIGRNANPATWRAGRPHVHRRIQPTMNPNIFKAYDVRGLYPAELDEQSFTRSAARSSPISKRSASASGATCACRRPALAAAFIAGAREQGADVVDYGMIATDMIYYAVGDRRSRRRRADHRLAQSEAVQRLQDGRPRATIRSAATAAFPTSAT